ncbi:DnaT-like ssDNA-binding domain-containing protein [Buchnera aphidicola (Ceratoglyphina bambusae)]|uniref:DnaT-like ssDNA-binding domain-containing protein n=1 Tax=Buchnera aphidicola TaxID=9 RepID=UPI0031B84E9E
MNMKKINSLNETIENFIKNPLKILYKSKKEIISIVKNDMPVMYIFSPKSIKKIISKNNKYIKKKKIKRFNNIINKKILESKLKMNHKFSMHKNWKPDKDFLKKASIWGININKKVSKNELNAFIDYWEAEGRFLHNIQWQQKLAYSLKITRSIKSKVYKNEINKICSKNSIIPDGFRDK